MTDNKKIYICIDLKSFYASVECVERGLDPMKHSLVVADPSRGRGAICLAISTAMKARGVRNRCRIFEIPDGMEYTVAVPRMKLYMMYSADIYSVYLRYIAKEDIHVYSIDECFIDATPYLSLYGKTPKELAVMLIEAVFDNTGIRAAAGIGTNLFLAKVALDITAKHSPDFIGCLDEEEFRRTIQHHRPITDIWNIGGGIARRLERMCAFDLYDVTQLNEKRLYKEFGVNAELLIDHAHGREPCTMNDIHNFKTESRSISNSQILFENYLYDEAMLVLKEMIDGLTLELVEQRMCTNSISLVIGYSDDTIPPTGGSVKLRKYTDSCRELTEEFLAIFRRKTHREMLIRKITISFNGLIAGDFRELDFFTDAEKLERESKLSSAVINLRNRYGKNAVIKGMSLLDKATAQARNKLVGGHNGE